MTLPYCFLFENPNPAVLDMGEAHSAYSEGFRPVFRRKAATIPSEAGHGSDTKTAAFEAVVGKVAGMARKIME